MVLQNRQTREEGARSTRALRATGGTLSGTSRARCESVSILDLHLNGSVGAEREGGGGGGGYRVGRSIALEEEGHGTEGSCFTLICI